VAKESSLAQLLGDDLGTFQNPPSLHWKAIESDNFEIIFPEEITTSAQRIANTLEHIYTADSKSLKVKPKKLSLILHNQNTISNGFVNLAPRRSEWFNTPPQSGPIDPTEWYNLLAVHEFRHVAQFDKTNSGFTRILYYLFGENGWFLGSMVSVPIWFWEGDAVGMETILTRGGRGRMPNFDMPIRTLLLSGRRFSYYKMISGSYRDWFANPYPLGYLMTTYVKRHYGVEVWPEILSQTSKFSFLPYSFSLSLKGKTGKGVVGTYKATMNELENLWKEQLTGVTLTGASRINRKQNGFLTYYLYPQHAPDGSLIVAKYGLGDQPTFIKIDVNGREEFLFYPGDWEQTPFSVAGDKLVWGEFEYDPRWSWRDFTVIKVFDLSRKKIRRITSQTRLHAPALSPDGRMIAAVEYDTRNQSHLVILNSETGKEIRRLDNPGNILLMIPRWSPDGKQIVLTRLGSQGKALTIVHLDEGTYEDVVPFGLDNIWHPVYCDHYILFNASYSGIDNIYALDLSNRQIYQVTSRKYGAFNPAPSPDGKWLAFNDYTKEGYNVAEMPLNPTAWVKLEDVARKNINYSEPLIVQEAGSDILDSIPRKIYPVKGYNEFSHLLNIHSWYLFSSPEEENSVISLLSMNRLGTFQSSLGYQYNSNEKTSAGFLNASYGGFYPLIDFGGSYGERASTYRDQFDKKNSYHWQESTFDLGFRLPLNLSRGVYQTSFSLGAKGSYTRISDLTYLKDHDKNNGFFTPLTYRFSFFRGYQWISDLNPVWGQTIDIVFRHTPFKGDYHGRLFSAQTSLFFPGLFKRNSLHLEAAYEEQNPGGYWFDSEILFPRGYSYQFHERIAKGGINYAFPLWYPDLNILSIMYFKRWKTNLFYDYGVAWDGDNDKFYRSFGTELTTDMNIFNLPINFDLGVRYSYLLETKKHVFEFVFGFSN
jgi:hypothetical protein